MANQRSDAEMQDLPSELQPLYRRLTDDGAAWQAASAAKISVLARSLVDDIEHMTSDTPVAMTASDMTDTAEVTSDAPVATRTIPPARRRRRDWIFGTVAAIAVVALLALVLQSALVGRRVTGPTHPAVGKWQILDHLTWKRTSSAQELPIIAPTNPQVIYEAINSISGQGGKAVLLASLRRTDDGGATWHSITLPLPIAAVESISLRVSPLRAQTVFLSLWDRTSITCEPTNGTVGEGCERGYISTDSGASWHVQTLPVRGILDTSGAITAQEGRLYAQNVCNDDTCVHLLVSSDGGLTWQVVDNALTAKGYHVCDFTATASGHTVYAAISQTRCLQPPSSKSLWRSDDAGAHWLPLGALHSQPAGGMYFTAGNGTLLVAPSSAQRDLLYLNLPYASASSGPRFQYSEDRGLTWKTTPSVDAAPDVPPSAPNGLGIGTTAVLSDGSLVYVQDNPRGGRATAYIWTPGARVWRALPPLPTEVAGPGSILVTPGANGHDTITMVMRANGDASNPTAYYIIRIQL